MPQTLGGRYAPACLESLIWKIQWLRGEGGGHIPQWGRGNGQHLSISWWLRCFWPTEPGAAYKVKDRGGEVLSELQFPQLLSQFSASSSTQ